MGMVWSHYTTGFVWLFCRDFQYIVVQMASGGGCRSCINYVVSFPGNTERAIHYGTCMCVYEYVSYYIANKLCEKAY